jgi:hypothetical protein
MGYDCQMLRCPEPRPDYEPQYADDPGYFRVVQHGMPVLVAFMLAAGVLDDDEEAPAFPAWPPAGLSDDARASLLMENDAGAPPPMTEAEQAALAAWEEHADAVRATRSKDPGAVPNFKFGLQMDWFVSEEEAHIIASGLRRTLTEEPATFLRVLAQVTDAELSGDDALAWIASWAKFNEVAAEHGGYRIE